MSKRRVALMDYHAMRKEFDHATESVMAILGASYRHLSIFFSRCAYHCSSLLGEILSD
jgi:hypothetical protein